MMNHIQKSISMYKWQINITKWFTIFCIHLFLQLQNMQAQELSKNTKVFSSPPEFKNPSGNSGGIEFNYDGTNVLIVYSDRDENPAYASAGGAGGSTIVNRAKFLQPFVVIEQSGEYLRLVACDGDLLSSIRSSGKNRTLPLNAKVFGWINRSKLLLWSHCLVDERNNISRKALSIINDVTVLNDLGRYLNQDSSTLKIFSSPDCDPATQNLKQIRLAQFMFIYKSDQASYLIGVAPLFYVSDASDKVFGWVSKDVIKTWSDRMCYEPNWNSSAVAERKADGVKASLFGTPEEAISYYSGDKNNSNPYWADDPLSGQRADPYQKRFPLLDRNEVTGVIETGLITDIINKKGDTILNRTQQNQMTRATAENVIKERRNINIVFVIDADPSLKEFAIPVMDAVTRSIGWIENEQFGSNIYNFGAVIYYPKSDNGSGNTEVHDLTNGQDVNRFIRDKINAASGITSSTNRSMYKGIEDALRMFGDRASQTNYIVLVGSAGDEKNPATESKLIGMMSKTITGFIGFQTNKGDDPSFQNFVNELSNLMRETSKSINSESRKYPVGSVPVPLFNINVNNTIYSLDYPTTSAVDGKLFCAHTGRPMATDELTKTLQDMIESTNDKTEENVADINNITIGAGDRNFTINAVMQRWLTDVAKANVDMNTIAKFAGENFQFFIRTYFKPKMQGLQNDIMLPVLLMTNEECVYLKSSLEKFKAVGTEDEKRQAYIDAYKSIYRAYRGSQELDDEAFAKVSAKDIQQLLSGNVSDAASSILKNYTIDNLKDPRKFKQEDFDKLQTLFNTKIQSFKAFTSNARLNSFELLDQSYFWVPVDYIP